MRSVSCWRDLESFGIICLTGEACSLSYRILFDVTSRGAAIISRCFGIPGMKFGESWNRGTPENPHIGSIMLTQQMLVPLAVFALLESECREVYLIGDIVIGIEKLDPFDTAATMMRVHKAEHARRFAYGGPGAVGDRNVHQASGRIE